MIGPVTPGERHDETLPDHAADRLTAVIDRVGSPACVGIDPVLDRLPATFRDPGTGVRPAADAIAAFSIDVLDVVADRVGCVKLQSACFERYRWHGVRALHQVIIGAKERGLEVIVDGKRGDIGISAEHYAAAAFEHVPDAAGGAPDWVTVNCYLGAEGMTPFLRPGSGAFALVRTSNPSGDAVQAQRLADGPTVAESVARLVADLGRSFVGRCGFSALGAVVAATKPAEIEALRGLMPQQIFLVPGFGAQGGRAEDIRRCFVAGGRGAVVTASRSVIYAFDPDAAEWRGAVADAADAFADEVGLAAGMR
jgi:orotidine-5'-phosphate decarboxylase